MMHIMEINTTHHEKRHVWRFLAKFTTKCAGTNVEIRGNRNFVGCSKEEVICKEAVELLGPSIAGHASSSFSGA